MKKFIIVGVLVFAFALTMNFAFAGNCECSFPGCLCPSTTVTNINGAMTMNNVSADSGTGLNSINHVLGAVSIKTGAASAVNVTQTQANDNKIDVVTSGIGKLTILNANNAGTINSVSATAGTGVNSIGCAGGSSISTGTATTTAQALTIVNTNVVKVNRCCSMGCGSVCDNK